MTNKKVLIVEDDRLLREAYCHILSDEGFMVESASDGLQATEILKSYKPHVILLDILMPHSDGLDFLKRTNLPKKFPGTKVIVFSNLSSIDKIDEMLTLGASRHVLKSSLSPKDLVTTVQDLCEER